MSPPSLALSLCEIGERGKDAIPYPKESDDESHRGKNPKPPYEEVW